MSQYQIEITTQAARDIEEFLVYAEFSDAAVRFAEYLTNDRLRLLSDFPKIFPLVDGCTGVRKIAESPFLIFYRVHEQERVIRVLRYWHGAKEGKPFLG